MAGARLVIDGNRTRRVCTASVRVRHSKQRHASMSPQLG